ncbi:MAG: 23S rRNA (adenine(2030)-N(6))-methyltransferase RlmJ [Moraxella sp.]
MVKAHKKWSTGVLALWYPIKNNDAVELFYKKMKRTEIRRQLVLELNIFPTRFADGFKWDGYVGD